MRNTFALGAAALLSSLSVQAVAPKLDPAPYDVTIPVKDEPSAAPIGIGAVKVTYGGFIKLDALFSVFSDGDVASLDQGRDYFRPATIPVAASSNAEDAHSMLDLHAKDSRFWFKADTEVAGHALTGTVEVDYRTLASGATEVVTNAFLPRVRRAVLTYDHWTLGQEWTTFRNADAAPENLDDLGGPVEALNIVRQPLLRYETGGFAVALENSETYLLPNGGASTHAAFVTGDSQVPDLVARYDLATPFGKYGVSALGRSLKADQAATGAGAPFNVADGQAFGWGAELSGKAPSLFDADVRFSFMYGDGLGRYVGLGSVPDAVVDATGGLETLQLAAGYVSYHQPWNPRWRSNLTVGALEVTNGAALGGPETTKSVESAHLNLLYEPVAKLLFGVEVMHAVRKLESGEDGLLDRAQFSAKYSF